MNQDNGKNEFSSLNDVLNVPDPEIEETRPQHPWICDECHSVNTNWTYSIDWLFKRTDDPWVQGECRVCKGRRKLEEQEEQQVRRQRQRLRRIQEIYKRSGMPRDYGRFSFKKLKIRKGAEKAFSYFSQVSHFKGGSPFVILSGVNNTGKSVLLGALCNKLSLNEIPSFYINEALLFGRIKEGFDSVQPIEKDLYDAFRSADVILWDEFVFFNYTEKAWIYERVYRLIEEAAETGKVMALATNHDLKDLPYRCGKRIWARLERKRTNFIRMENSPFFSGLNVL
jgi:DNA replication protein DnaC